MAKKEEKSPFEKLLEELNEKTSGKGGIFYHPVQGKTKFRMVLEPGAEPTEFYREVINRWGKTRYMVAAVILDAPDWETDEEEPKGPELRALVLPVSAFKEIVGYLVEGFDLFDPEKGHGVSVIREGEGKFDTSYHASPSPQAVDLTEFEIAGELPEGGLDEWAQAYNQRDTDTAAEEEEKSKKKKSKTGLPW